MSKTEPARKPLEAALYFKNSVRASIRKLRSARLLSPGKKAESLENILETLVAFPTVTSDIVANRGAIKYVERFLKTMGMYTEYHELNGHPALWAITQSGQKHPRVLLAAHMDVVAAPKPLFHLREEDDTRYYGRGVVDMKGALAAYLHTIYELRHQLRHYNFGVMVTSDEETAGQESGVYHFMQQGYTADFVILPDGGDNWKIERSAKGLIHVTLEAYGKAAHASRPWLGENALDKLAKVLNELRGKFANQGPETNTLSIGSVNGGEVYNRIPAYVTSEVDIRTIDEKSALELMKLVEDLCKKYDVKPTFKGVFMPTQHSLDNPYTQAFMQTVKEVRGTMPQTMMSFGGSDARFFTQKGVPVAVFYPKGSGHHGDTEWVEKKSLHQMEQVFTTYIRKYARADGGEL